MTINYELASKAKELIKEVFGKYNEKINEILDNIQFDIANSTSHFDRQNKVYINPRSLNDLSVYVHELLHAVSTSTTFYKQYIGLHKKYMRKINDDLFVETSMGYAINEGATEFYTRNVLAGNYVKAKSDTSYNFCSNIYKNLEKVLTPEASKILYINGNVDRFIQTVAYNAHTSEENVMKLIMNMDAYFDTYRIYNAFMLKPDSADVKHLLANCYTYLAVILTDYAKFCGKEFNIWEDINRDYLSKDELVLFAEVLQKVDTKKVKNNGLANLKLYDRMAMFMLTEQENGQLYSFDILPDDLRCGEFYNYLLLNTEFCDAKGIPFDIKTKDEKAKLTQKIFNEDYRALSVNMYLPQNLKTMLAARYAIRANTATSDYYMEICMNSNSFREFIKASDPDYCEALCELIKNKEQQQTQEDFVDKEYNKE